MSNRVQLILNDLLNAAVALVDDPPKRQLITHGDHAVDCDMLAVVLHDLHLEAEQGARCTVQPVVPVEIVLARSCWPMAASTGASVQRPDTKLVTAAALRLAGDVWDLAIGMQRLNAAGELFPNTRIPCASVTFGASDPIGPTGNIAGWRLHVDVRP